MKNLTANLENSQRLAAVAKEKGVELPESYFWWKTTNIINVETYLVSQETVEHFDDTGCDTAVFGECESDTLAYTAGELGEMLPNKYSQMKSYFTPRGWCSRWDYKKGSHIEFAPTEADARCLMLIHLLEEGLITNV